MFIATFNIIGMYLEFIEEWEVTGRPFTSIKQLTQDDAFKCYVNKAILVSYLKRNIALNVFSRFFSAPGR